MAIRSPSGPPDHNRLPNHRIGRFAAPSDKKILELEWGIAVAGWSFWPRPPATVYVPNTAAPNFVADVQLGLFNRNHNGPWSIGRPTIIASATIIPEPSRVLLVGLGMCLTLGRRRRNGSADSRLIFPLWRLLSCARDLLPYARGMAGDSFVHLHLHTEYSLLDGAIRIPDLMVKASKQKMPAVAMTDHGNLFGSIEFYQQAKKHEIKPIIGCEAYLAPGSLYEKKEIPGRKKNSHLTLLARNAEGYANLTRLISLAHLEGQYYKPRIDKEHLEKFREGLICLSGCITGEINQFLLADRIDEARESVRSFIDIFGKDDFYIEIHDHGLEPQEKTRPHLLQFAEDFGLKTVAANDVHFLNRSHHEAHDVMICIGTNNLVDDENRMHYPEEVYFKTAKEMRQLFKEVPGACDMTLEIAERCGFEMELDATSIARYPVFEPEGGEDIGTYFRRLCQEGLVERYGETRAKEAKLQERLEYEIGIMESLGFLSYFIITWDFIKWAKDHGIPVGPGRGSAAGSLVAYVLRITDLCPLRFGLIFERFLNPERVSPPDIDIDFCQTRRPEVIQYVREKYGERAVSHIITFGTLGAKSVVRDVARVMGLSYSEGDRIAKMIPTELNITLADAKKKNAELREAIEREETTARLWQHATFLEGLTRNAGIHAAGVVIADCDLDEHCPLTRGNEDEVVTQFAMGPLTDLGMLKMDFLGLKTLTVIQDAVDLVHRHAPDFDIDAVPLDDPETFALIQRGETAAVFQLESGGMVNLCRQMGVDRIEDIIALIALYRPGPMDLIPDYIDRKKGKKKVRYLHPLLEEVSEETYGILIYQEQVQKAANLLAGFSLGDGDILRRAMGKKKLSEMVAQRKKFVDGCRETNKIKEKDANAIFDLLEKFAGYGFNKSHSAAYGVVSYRTAYMKANHPLEFMAAVLSNEVNNTDKIAFFVAECQRMGIEILPPDINRSSLKFAPENTGGNPGSGKGGSIRYGLAAIKNVGAGAMETVLVEREANGPFKGMEDVANRVDSQSINKKALESLVKAGAFDFTGEDRASLFARIEGVVASAAAHQRDQRAGQTTLFGIEELNAPPPAAVDSDGHEIQPWPKAERLGYEKELLGFYVTGHPLDDFRSQIESGRYGRLGNLQSQKEMRKKATFAGLVGGLEVKFTRKDGKPFAVFTVEDFSGSAEVIAWSDVYQKRTAILENGKVLALRARVEIDSRSEMRRLVLDDCREMEPDLVALMKAAENGNGQNGGLEEALLVRLAYGFHTEADLLEIRNIVTAHPGPVPLRLQFTTPTGQRIAARAEDACSVTPSAELLSALERWL